MRWIPWVILLVGCGSEPASPVDDGPLPPASAGLEVQAEDYAQSRASFRTRLIRHGPSLPSADHPETPVGSEALTYLSDGRKLTAFVTPSPTDGRKHPAVLFLHGGFGFGGTDWKRTRPYREAGFVVMVPLLRGENGQEGEYSLFYDEVDDVLAAADTLAKRPSVDPTRLFVAGHSVGGTLTMLASMASRKFRAAASFSGSPDQVEFVRGRPDRVPFNPSDHQEFQMRSPVAHPNDFKCPTRLYFGDEEIWLQASTRRTVILARRKGLDVESVEVPGDHGSMVPTAIDRSIPFFRQAR